MPTPNFMESFRKASEMSKKLHKLVRERVRNVRARYHRNGPHYNPKTGSK